MKEGSPTVEWQEAALRSLDANRLVWLLFFASRGSPIITTSKTDNFERIGPQVERYAKKIGFEDVDIDEGYKSLCQAPVQGKKGQDTLFNRDKANRVCRYTDIGSPSKAISGPTAPCVKN